VRARNTSLQRSSAWAGLARRSTRALAQSRKARGNGLVTRPTGSLRRRRAGCMSHGLRVRVGPTRDIADLQVRASKRFGRIHHEPRYACFRAQSRTIRRRLDSRPLVPCPVKRRCASRRWLPRDSRLSEPRAFGHDGSQSPRRRVRAWRRPPQSPRSWADARPRRSLVLVDQRVRANCLRELETARVSGWLGCPSCG